MLSRISFEFCTCFLQKDGTEGLGTIEPPEWSLYINKIHRDEDFSASGTSDRFTVPEKKETVATGIDVYYVECYVIYNTDRQPYWLPVTVKEEREQKDSDYHRSK